MSEMLEIVAKRAALRPSDPSSSLQSEPVSLPVLPPQTTINPLLQQLQAHSDHRYQPIVSKRNVHTFSSQSHNQEHDVSYAEDFMFDGTENFYLCTNQSLLHECEILLEKFERQNSIVDCLAPHEKFKMNKNLLLVILEFLVLYIAVLYYANTRL